MENHFESRIKFGLVGYGNIGKRHAEIIPSFGTLTAICDPVFFENENKIKLNNGLYIFNSFEEFIAQHFLYDIVVICTPNGLHAQQCAAALQQNKHVICEKPLALHYEECILLRDLAKEVNRKLIVVKQNRYHSHLKALKKMLDNDILGKIFSVQVNCFWHRGEDYFGNSWRGKKLDGGILYTQFSHFFDLLIWYFGPVKESQAMGANFNHKYCKDFEDTILANLQFENGNLVSLHATLNAFEKNLEGSILIFSEKATVKVSGTYLNSLECLQGEESILALVREINDNQPKDYDIKNNHIFVYQHFIHAIQNDISLSNELDEAILSIACIENLYKKMKKL